MKPETQRWVELAEGNMDMAEAGLERGRYGLCVFHCHQAVELLLKAIWVEGATEGLPRRTHDLVSLSKELGLGLSEEQLEFLRKLSEQYIPSRYGDVPVEYSQETAENYYNGMKELFAWLRQRLS